MTRVQWLHGATALALVAAFAAPTQAQSNFTLDEARWVLIDNQNGREWPCGMGYNWLYNNTFSTTYNWAKNTAPGAHAASPYGSGGGWRLPSTAELSDAINKGLYAELRNVSLMCKERQVVAGVTQDDPEYIWGIPEGWQAYWVVDPRTTKKDAYYLVLGTGERVKTSINSSLYFLLVR